MANFRVSAIAGQRLDEIYAYTREKWGDAQAEAYVRGLFDCFGRIARRELLWRAIPAEFGVDGYYGKCEHHYVYWIVSATTPRHKGLRQFRSAGRK